MPIALIGSDMGGPRLEGMAVAADLREPANRGSASLGRPAPVRNLRDRTRWNPAFRRAHLAGLLTWSIEP